MTDGKKNKSSDVNVTAFEILNAMIGKCTTDTPRNGKPTKKPSKPPIPIKNPAAVALGRLGGLKGGKARANKLTAIKRAEIARLAARARWKSGKT